MSTIDIVAHQQSVHTMKHSNLLIHAMPRPYTDAVMVSMLGFHGFFIGIPAKFVVHDESDPMG